MVFTDSELDQLTSINLASSALSFCGSLFIVVCFWRIPDLRTFAYRLVFFLSVSDICYSIGNFLGDPAPHYGADSARCQIQAVILSYFELTSLYWSIAIAHVLHLTILRKETVDLAVLTYRYHAIIWTVPLFFTFLPFATNSYGDAAGWCWIADDSASDKAWRFIQFYVQIWLGIVYNAIVFFRVYRTLSTSFEQNEQTRRMRERLRYYPAVLVICYFWASINRITQIFIAPVFWLACLHIFFASLSGLLNAMVYGLIPDVRNKIRRQLPEWCPWRTLVEDTQIDQSRVGEFDAESTAGGPGAGAPPTSSKLQGDNEMPSTQGNISRAMDVDAQRLEAEKMKAEMEEENQEGGEEIER